MPHFDGYGVTATYTPCLRTVIPLCRRCELAPVAVGGDLCFGCRMAEQPKPPEPTLDERLRALELFAVEMFPREWIMWRRGRQETR